MKTPQTPSPKLRDALGLTNEVWIKREDRHHYGSHKGRSIPLMVNNHFKSGSTSFVISSSGNAALAAIYATQAHNNNKPATPITLHIFIGEHIEPEKKLELTEYAKNDKHITIEQVTTPKQAAILFEKEKGAKLLRQSTDDVALLGYAELAKELAKIEHLAAVFAPTSSGTTAQGLHIGFDQLGINPEIHIIQTTACHPIVDALPNSKKNTDAPSLAHAIVDNVAHRKDAVVAVIQKSNGAGWIATDDEIRQAIAVAKETTDLDLSPNSALALVGLEQAIRAGRTWSGPVAILITGK